MMEELKNKYLLRIHYFYKEYISKLCYLLV